MKRSLMILLISIMILTLSACSASESETGTQNMTGTQVSQEPAEEEQTDTDTETGNMTLVIYFSGSGNTERVAQITAEEIGADLFELEPVQPYSEDDLNWRDRSSRVNAEHDDPALQDIELQSIEVENWENYDTILIGYPLWWREAPWPMNNFIKNNDFSGKNVITFCTSTSNGLGDSGKNLAAMANGGNWIDGIRFVEHAEESSIREWARSLNLE